MLAPRPPRRPRAILSALLSLGIHLFVVIPFLLPRLLIVHDPPAIELTYLDDQDAAPDGKTDKKDESRPEPPRLAQADKPKVEEPPAPEPEKRKEKERKEEEKKLRPLEVIPNAHLKMVDQDQFPEEEDNPDAHYLAQENHRAEKETRAEQSNLLRNQQGEAVSSPSESEKKEPGDKDHKVAELMDRAGDAKKLPVQNLTEPERGPALDLSKERPSPPLNTPLAMRDEQVKAQDGLEMATPGDAPTPLQQEGRDADSQAQPHAGARARLGLTHDDYERIVGFEVAEAERRAAALSQRSHTPGRWDRLEQKLSLMRSSLENFTPTVRPGNQTELGTRKHPFAAYIATMHRQIHKFWGYGFLADIELRPSGPFSDMALWTGVEITLKPDGTIDRLIIEHPSGQSAFDVAAMDAVMSAGPFPAPPPAIKSRDGKVYLSWRFHRDERQCATDFVDPHILTIPPRESPGDAVARPAPKKELDLYSMGRPQRTPRAGSGMKSGPFRPSAPPQLAPEAPEPKEPMEEKAPRRAATATGGVGGVPAEARVAAEKWLTAYRKGDARWLAGYSAVPFSAGGKTVAEDGTELRAMYHEMLKEGDERGGTLSFFTPDEIRRKLGRLPPGGAEEDMMFAMLKSGQTDLLLLLQPADKGWRVVGIDR